MKRWRRKNVVQEHFGQPRHRTSFRGFDEQQRYSSKRKLGWLVFAPVWIGAALVGTAYGAGWLNFSLPKAAVAKTQPTAVFRASFSLCFTGGGYNCVVDGDTIWLQGTKIRVAGIDAPETHEPRCKEERERGDRATVRLRQLLNGGAVTVASIDRDEDVYGRKLRIVYVDGHDVGDVLVREGLARPYGNGRQPWC